MSRKTSETLMFDSGFERSRIYFKTLQILRIFTQMIERTRRDVELFNPQVSVSDWMLPLMRSKYNRTRGEDAALLANWDILWSFYVQKEEYLLRRLLNKTEELKSLRDGVSQHSAGLHSSAKHSKPRSFSTERLCLRHRAPRL